MELILIYFFIKVKAKAAEIGQQHKGISYLKSLFLCWLAGELLGAVFGFKLTFSWAFRYLIGSSCGIGAGWLVYRKIMSLEQRYPDYFDLRQSKTYPDIDAEPELITKKSNPCAELKRNDHLKTKSLPIQEPLQSNPNYHQATRPATEPETNPEYTMKIESEMKPEYTVKVKPEIKPEYKPEIKPEYKPEIKLGLWADYKGNKPRLGAEYHSEIPLEPEPEPENQAETKPHYRPETNIGFKIPTETAAEEADATIGRHIFQFPYSELSSINELVIGEYGHQTVKDHAIANCPWFEKFKAKYENRNFKAAAMILEDTLCEDLNDGLTWLMFGILYKDGYQDFDKALQFCLSGARRCNSYKIALLTEAAELLLIGRKDILNAFKFFCLAIVAITDSSKAWGNSGINGCIAQERAFHFIRVLLTAYNFHDYRLYLERNIQFSTGLDQALIEKVLAIATESPFRTEMEERIPQLFPAIIEKVQALG
jgi:hypothetical protein